MANVGFNRVPVFVIVDYAYCWARVVMKWFVLAVVDSFDDARRRNARIVPVGVIVMFRDRFAVGTAVFVVVV